MHRSESRAWDRQTDGRTDGQKDGSQYRLMTPRPAPCCRAGYDNVKRTTHTHTHPFDDPLSGTTRVSRYQKGKTNLDFTEATDSEWHWHQLGHMQVCTSLQTDNHSSTPQLSFLQAGCPSCRPTNSVKALKARALKTSQTDKCRRIFQQTRN